MMNDSLPMDSIIYGDCMNVLKGFPTDCIDLTITSPPYDALRNYKGYSFDFEGIAQELYRVIKPGGVVVWVVGDETIDGSETGTSFQQALYFRNVCGFNLHDTMIYVKQSSPYPSDVRYYQQFEYMFVLSKSTPKTINLLREIKLGRAVQNNFRKSSYRQKSGETKRLDKKRMKKFIKADMNPTKIKSNIWQYNAGHMLSTTDIIAFKHPAIFPEKLAEDHILSWSTYGDIVLDPFVGSGTTCKMAMLNGRHYIGIDVSKEYCDIARKRINQYKRDEKMKLITSKELSKLEDEFYKKQYKGFDIK